MSSATTDSPGAATVIQLRVYPPDEEEGDPEERVAPGSLEHVELSERVQGTHDSATLTLTGEPGAFTETIQPGDRLELHEGVRGTRPYSSGPYSDGPYGGEWKQLWTGLARGVTYDREHAGKTTVTVEAEDYVFGILNMRTAFHQFEKTQISGTNESIVETLVHEYAPELDTQFVEPIDEITDAYFDGRTLLDALTDMARRSDAIIYSRGTGLGFMALDDLTPAATLTGRDMGAYSVRINDDQVVNDLRVVGGTDHRPDQSQETIDRTLRLRGDDEGLGDRVMFPIQARKDRYSRIEIWTDRITGSESALTVRLQNDRNGKPVAVDDEASDISRKQVPHHFLSKRDWTTFLLPFGDQSLPPGDQIWVIIEAEVGDGQRIGVNDDGHPAFIAHFPFTISVQLDRPESIRRNRRRQAVIKRENIDTFAGARDFGRAYLRAHDRPHKEVSFRAQSWTAHGLNVGEAVTAALADETATGDYIVAQKNINWEANTRDTTLAIQQAETL